MDGQQVARTSRGRSNRNKCTEGWAWELGWGMGCTGSGQRAVFRVSLNAMSPGVSKRSAGVWEP